MTQFNLDQMTTDELYRLRRDISDKLGFYDLLTLTVEDIQDHLAETESDIDMTEDNIREALAYVCRKYDGNDYIHALEWAVNVLESNAEEKA